MSGMEWLFLQIYPRAHREEYGEEILSILRNSWAEAATPGARFRLCVREMAGALWVGGWMRVRDWEGWPVAGGLSIAFGAHLLLYSVLGTLLGQVQLLFAGDSREFLPGLGQRQQSLALLSFAFLMVQMIVLFTIFLTRGIRLRKR